MPIQSRPPPTYQVIAAFCVCGAVLIAIHAPRSAASCRVGPMPLESTLVSVALSPTKNADLNISHFAVNEAFDDAPVEATCRANVTVPLSAYPTYRLAARPADFASAMRTTLEKWKVKKCSVVVWFENDTNDEMQPGEECLKADFHFGREHFWPDGSERSCYDT